MKRHRRQSLRSKEVSSSSTIIPPALVSQNNNNNNNNKRSHHRHDTFKLQFVLTIVGIINIVGLVWIANNQQSSQPSAGKGDVGHKLVGIRSHTTTSRSHRYHYDSAVTLSKLTQLLGDDDDNTRTTVLPPWWMIEEQYGKEPKILGLDRCEEYRRVVSNTIAGLHILAPAGLFNSGTNLLSQLLKEHCHIIMPSSMMDDNSNNDDNLKKTDEGEAQEILEESQQTSSGPLYVGFQPPWGKHTPAKFRLEHTLSAPLYQNMDKSAVLPIVLIRHPYDWMDSTCHKPYAIYWGYSSSSLDETTTLDQQQRRTCPNLLEESNKTTTKPILVSYGVGNVTYETLAHLWNQWNRDYFDSIAYPRLMIRLEDLIFRPQRVVTDICTCAGGTTMTMTTAFKVSRASAKSYSAAHAGHDGTDTITAWIKYGWIRDWKHFPERDKRAARQILDRQLMEDFGYQHPTTTTTTSSSNHG